MDEPRLCIVGAGALSSRRIYPLIAPAGGKIVAACDLDAGKARRQAHRYGAKAYPAFREMLAEQTPDGVIVCVGPAHHASLAMEILQLGFPVYTEKPPAETAADALAVARVAAETGLLCVTAFKKRYTAAADRAKTFIDRFPPEDLYSISLDYCSAQYENDPRNPHRTFLLDFAIHGIDLIQYLFGDIAEVFAFSKGLDAYAVSLRFANGAVGSVNLNCGRSFSIPTEEIEITARGGQFMTISNSSRWRITEDNRPAEWREPPTFTSAGDSGRDTGHLSELEDFVNALREGRTTSRSQIYESYRTMVLYEAIRDSARTGRVVPLHFEPL
ncbi:MAG: gfo/Idh/MocA family oxidoreductase [Puniceicoccaceae bacterium]|nr:MAG: gfo/Idh/MocA family oxidoreductase [Puniceicoccaceae bacterium]